jgi:hypothetical protein
MMQFLVCSPESAGTVGCCNSNWFGATYLVCGMVEHNKMTLKFVVYIAIVSVSVRTVTGYGQKDAENADIR